MRTIIALCVLALAACGSSGGDGGGGSTASCTVAAEAGYGCFEASGLDAADVVAFGQACTYEGGTPGTSGCTATNRVGRCAFALYGYAITASYYPPATVQQGQAACTQLAGTWTSG